VLTYHLTKIVAPGKIKNAGDVLLPVRIKKACECDQVNQIQSVS